MIFPYLVFLRAYTTTSDYVCSSYPRVLSMRMVIDIRGWAIAKRKPGICHTIEDRNRHSQYIKCACGTSSSQANYFLLDKERILPTSSCLIFGHLDSLRSPYISWRRLDVQPDISSIACCSSKWSGCLWGMALNLTMIRLRERKRKDRRERTIRPRYQRHSRSSTLFSWQKHPGELIFTER